MPTPASSSDPTGSGLAAGIVPFRWIAAIWVWVLAWITRTDMARPWLAVAVAAAIAAATVATTIAADRRRIGATPRWLIAVEVAVGIAAAASGGWIYRGGDAFGRSEAFGWAWPVAGILGAGIALGPWVGAGCGAAVSTARVVAIVANGSVGSLVVSRQISSTLLFIAGGATAGLVAERLRRADRVVATARARDELARDLHDGVLQTLAVIARRGDDDVAVMARRSERELRTFLFGMATIDASRSDPTSVDLGAKLRRAAARVDDLYGSSVQVVVAPDLLPIPAIAADALASAAAEAIMNAAKHANAATIHVYAELEDGGTTCSVRDDGVGFDPGRPATGQGLRSSIRERIDAVGGTVGIDSRRGVGTEIRLFVPHTSRGGSR
jgi:signal transduction histidine kinase